MGRRLAGGSMPALHDQLSDESIGAVIEAFYQKVRRDPALGPVFSPAIADDEWPDPLSASRAFLPSVIPKTGPQKGNPFSSSRTMGGSNPPPFGRWLGLFGET